MGKRVMTNEVRLHVSDEMHDFIRSASGQNRVGIATYVRELIAQEMRKLERQRNFRRIDPLIEEIYPLLVERMYPLVELMAEKLGVEMPDSEAENSVEKEG